MDSWLTVHKTLRTPPGHFLGQIYQRRRQFVQYKLQYSTLMLYLKNKQSQLDFIKVNLQIKI